MNSTHPTAEPDNIDADTDANVGANQGTMKSEKASGLLGSASNFILQDQAQAQLPPSELTEIASAVLDLHLQLDSAIGQQLQTVIEDTDGSAMMLMQSMRKLNNEALNVVTYINQSTERAMGIERGILGGENSIAHIANFVEELPNVMAQDVAVIHDISREIAELTSLVNAVREISRRTDMLAINASIEAHHAGQFGRSFKVIANEVRSLADRASQATSKIDLGLTQAQEAVKVAEDKIVNRSTEQVKEISAVVASIKQLQESSDDMRQFYKTMLIVTTEHNAKVANELAEMLGQIQYQDVVRQRIERLSKAVTNRNSVLQAFVACLYQPGIEMETMPEQMQMVLNQYVQGEQCHAAVKTGEDGENSLPKFELF